jgi:hypothetical protein
MRKEVTERFLKFRNIANATEEKSAEAIKDFEDYVYNTGYDISRELRQSFVQQLETFGTTVPVDNIIRTSIQELKTILSDPGLDLRAAVIHAERIIRHPSVEQVHGLANSMGKIFRAKQDVERAVAYIQGHKAQFDGAPDQPKFQFLTGKPEAIHAEMKILDELYQRPTTEEILPKIYIANSKRCCASCGRAIDVIKERRPDLANITTSGKSEKFYGWIVPEFIVQDAELSKAFRATIPDGSAIPTHPVGTDERQLSIPPAQPLVVTPTVGQAPAASTIDPAPISPPLSRSKSFLSRVSIQKAPSDPNKPTSQMPSH